MRVSIVTVSFNQARYLERALRSVAAQNHDDIEHILVDAGSTDGSRDIIERFRDRLAAVVLEPDRGPPDGLNKGFALATGDIFAYLNSDDEYLPGAVRAAVAEFRRRPDTDIVVGHGYIIDGDGNPIRRFRSAPFSPWRFARGGAVVMQQSTFFRAGAFRATSGFKVANRTSWDAELYLDMCLGGARTHLAEGYWSLFRIHPDSISGSGRLAAECARNNHRYFRRVTGRAPRPPDRASFLLAHLVRWLVDPRGLFERCRDLVRTPTII